jgi:2,3-bisphosphoglycerate-independent phosphoglycerate mutase
MTDHKLKGPLVLIILDGWGHRDDKRDNGIELAEKPFFDALWRDHPHVLIDGSGPAVGLPEGIMGNSEVGHMNLGAGRVVYSGLSQIYRAIADGSFFTNAALLRAARQAKSRQATLHLMGLLSDGAVHSHEDHLYALLELAKREGVEDVAVHCFLDGRDTPPKDGVKYLKNLQDKMRTLGVGRIASVMGRFFAMDRDKRWERTEKAFFAICGSSEASCVIDPVSYVESCHARGIGDEFVEPVSVALPSVPVCPLRADDAVIFFNFRADRARQISHAFVDSEFPFFDRGGKSLPAVFACMSPYDGSLAAPAAFTPAYPENTLADVLERHGIKQLRIAETEKYAHVTYFFNGGREVAHAGEENVLVPSPREVATYDLKPEMSAFLVRDEILKRLDAGSYGVIVANFANTDMVGHTAVPDAILKAVAAVDGCLKAIVPKILSLGGVVIVTADHGNAEEMKDANGSPMTAHTLNPVPFILAGMGPLNLRSGGRLCDVAPTMLKILGIPQPAEMTGRSLF